MKCSVPRGSAVILTDSCLADTLHISSPPHSFFHSASLGERIAEPPLRLHTRSQPRPLNLTSSPGAKCLSLLPPSWLSSPFPPSSLDIASQSGVAPSSLESATTLPSLAHRLDFLPIGMTHRCQRGAFRSTLDR